MEDEPQTDRAAERAGKPRRVGDTVSIGGDYQYRALTEGPRVQRFWHETKLWLARTYLQPRPGDRVLDVGCGSGVVAAALADMPVRECIGVDGNPSAIEFASKSFRRPNLRFVRGLIDELDFPDGHFDAVCCMELIEHIHLDQGRELLSTISRVLRPGGRLLVTTPNYRSAWPLIEWLMDRSGKVPKLAGEQHVCKYDHRTLTRVWEAQDWMAVRRHTCCTVAPWLAAASRSAAEKVRELEGALPFGTLLVHLLQNSLTGPRQEARGAQQRAA